MSAAIPLAGLQRQLESIYEIEIPHRVEDFLISDPALLDECQSGGSQRAEKLLVCQEGDDLYLSLYLDADLLGRLAAEDSDDCLGALNLQDACLALEGVSHFLYLAWSAAHERSVTLLELELQAEVDKYVAIAHSLSRQGLARIPSDLHGCLFEAVSFESDLSPEELERYQRANYFAAKYSRQLERRHRRLTTSTGMLNELRRFYRLGQQDKMRRIDQRR